MKKTFTFTFFLSIFYSVFIFAQTNIGVKQYPQLLENQISTSNAVVVEKLLTPKELVDININGMMSDPVLRNADWGFVVYDPKTNKIVSSYNETTPLVPASTTKLLTTETAMNLLGENFRWITQLEYSGEIDADGVLNGNLYIVGSGDPTLGTGKAGSSRYASIVSDYIYAISQEKGIKKINGDIIIQNAIFKENKTPFLPENIVWMEQNNYYLPVGSTKDIEPRNEKLLSASKNPVEKQKKFFYISPYVDKMVFANEFIGSIYTTKLPDAPYYLANSLRSTLTKSKIPVSGKVISKLADLDAEPRKIITAYRSPTLGAIIYDTNKRSDNASAEALLRMVGFQKKGDQSLESGRAVVTEHLAKSGFDMEGLSYYDGSGLSRNNKVSTISQVKFLTSLMSSKYYKSFFASLPIGGEDGTLKRMFNDSPASGQVFAKTGTLNKVKALTGFIKTDSGKTLVFSILVNNYSGSVSQVKSKMEELLEPVLKL
ncbi:D-alanyl-D-alanine carboxypeptidase/D-alanyl-D-alanine endopeptidase [Frigoriflavimonas asaccharolytica]|uniref:D-alanyl-D-alanine carboxypeptidase/D-alanyl-D-alanine-endopeptidase (Penicillin-binding protein 4) n=1 Tax=Frigoriflavimonas asaccharolytica TaxID=2735899 RepID=A0A8J8G6I3_9FLAO|nr:D-alanyl-D-alanine carboxypeptidase/D-alanyl-D-alanine-endopeptidase [Frigoriflavimonas asaccharolytica]NRS91911.1 D-alanyl-D-alanine carboxypeptidase/D-alanyl-D-alanine-endopeptidase (penicillin-binding protein 4) [Frigoriflavimonas asaccharolytica]